MAQFYFLPDGTTLLFTPTPGVFFTILHLMAQFYFLPDGTTLFFTPTPGVFYTILHLMAQFYFLPPTHTAGKKMAVWKGRSHKDTDKEDRTGRNQEKGKKRGKRKHKERDKSQDQSRRT